MPLNDKKVISMIIEQCASIEERCEGYREEIIGVITEILQYEQEHRVSKTNIQTKINDKCNATGRFLATQQGQASSVETLDS